MQPQLRQEGSNKGRQFLVLAFIMNEDFYPDSVVGPSTSALNIGLQPTCNKAIEKSVLVINGVHGMLSTNKDVIFLICLHGHQPRSRRYKLYDAPSLHLLNLLI